MTLCSSCRREQPGAYAYCPFCGAALDGASPQAASERKVVTSLFCDLVGFTEIGARTDPEDVDAMLSEYFDVARSRIEGHGGVVQKFIGDAVVGVFGVPAAHEDDPERAVRAGLRIVEDVERLRAPDGAPIRVRIGIDTGEALVRLGVTPESGEPFLTGDATNTASRIQSLAPPNGVAAGLSTYEATARVFDYEELEPALLKGKEGRVRVFRALAPVAHVGVGDRGASGGLFVGRERELASLETAFAQAVSERAVHLVTVVGEPGLGKSRLVAELMQSLDRSPELVTWRQGRCLPYGEGITFWALAEIVRAHAGILDSDSEEQARTRLEAVLPDVPERDWLRQQLAPLVGIDEPSPGGRGELFTAWRRFLESIAATGPAVLVFEDVHWADASLLDFIEELVGQPDSMPLLVICTARPEFGDGRPEFGTAAVAAREIRLARLSDEETVRLVASLADTPVLEVDVQRSILDRVGGNPLFAEEIVRLLRDRQTLVGGDSPWTLFDTEEIPGPDSVQSLIAARLDLLPPDAKALLADAAVMGKVFWDGAVAALGDRGLDRTAALLEVLKERQLIRAVDRSSLEGQREFRFWHALTCDVAYAQLPRRDRIERHLGCAAWIESHSGRRADELSDVLAHHYVTAYDLSCTIGDDDRAGQLESPVINALVDASRRALSVDAAASLAFAERARDVTAPGHPARAQVLYRVGKAAMASGLIPAAVEAYEESMALSLEAGDTNGAIGAMIALHSPLLEIGDARAWSLPVDALALCEGLPASEEVTSAVMAMAFIEIVNDRFEPGLDYAERALALSEESGTSPAGPLNWRGAARIGLGDRGGVDDMRQAIEIAEERGQAAGACSARGNLAEMLTTLEGPAAALDLVREGIEFARPRGLIGPLNGLEVNRITLLTAMGKVEEALVAIPPLLRELERRGAARDLVTTRRAEAFLLALQGRDHELTEVLDLLEPAFRAQAAVEAGPAIEAYAEAAFARGRLGHRARARELLAEVAEALATDDSGRATFSEWVDLMVATAISAGDLVLAGELVAWAEPDSRRAEHSIVVAKASLAEATGDLVGAASGFTDAASRWHGFGMPVYEAFALLGEARCRAALGDADGLASLRRARALFAGMGAAPFVAECDAVSHALPIRSASGSGG